MTVKLSMLYITLKYLLINVYGNFTVCHYSFFPLLSLSTGSLYLKKSEKLIGPAYKKVVYRRYKDETFTEEDTRSSDEEHLGILGNAHILVLCFAQK